MFPHNLPTLQVKDADIDDKTSAFRLVNAENDGIPGCIIDKYADIYSVEILAAGAEVQYLKGLLVQVV
ncbi:hypothetical protein [uncultured Fibrobacter sp.]|uniref:hypothetical protein n=1 Tax=uncultured Fibrobacter sp. TaxID=261512 RepID=UPI0025D9C92A|nr:hypothetical protein [uncultured Fibrobacter sp.]